MSPPPELRSEDVVDATVLARAGSTVERVYAGRALPRLREAGAADESTISASLSFKEFDGKPTVRGHLEGSLVLVCQRCMRPVEIDLKDDFQVIVVDEERADEPGGFEPVMAPPARLDVRWLIEDQTLLALPLVPMHEDEQCGSQEASSPERAQENDDAENVRHKPFENLRDMLRKR